MFATSVVAGLTAGFFSASVLAFSSTKSVPAIVSSELSGYLIVAVPSSPTVISVPAGNVLLPSPSLFASSIAFLTVSFSSFVKLVLSATSVFAGTVGSVWSAVVGVFAFTSASGETCFPAFSFAFTFSLLDSLLEGIVTLPVSWSIFIDGSVPSGSVHLPFSLVAVNGCAV